MSHENVILVNCRIRKFIMNAIRLILALFVIGCMSSCSKADKQTQKKFEADPDCVYICTGASSKRYRAVSDCMGLSRCSGTIEELSVDEALEYGKPHANYA